MKLISILSFALAMVCSSVPAMADTVHLDLSGGFTSEHSTANQVDGIYNYGGTLSKNLSPKFKVFVYGGQAIESAKSETFFANSGVYSAFVYNTGFKYSFSPATSFTASYAQVLGHDYYYFGPQIYHQINLESSIRVF